MMISIRAEASPSVRIHTVEAMIIKTLEISVFPGAGYNMQVHISRSLIDLLHSYFSISEEATAASLSQSLSAGAGPLDTSGAGESKASFSAASIDHGGIMPAIKLNGEEGHGGGDGDGVEDGMAVDREDQESSVVLKQYSGMSKFARGVAKPFKRFGKSIQRGFRRPGVSAEAGTASIGLGIPSAAIADGGDAAGGAGGGSSGGGDYDAVREHAAPHPKRLTRVMTMAGFGVRSKDKHKEKDIDKVKEPAKGELDRSIVGRAAAASAGAEAGEVPLVAAPQVPTRRQEAVYIKYLRVGHVFVDVTTKGFPLNLTRYRAVVETFVCRGEVLDWNKLVLRLERHAGACLLKNMFGFRSKGVEAGPAAPVSQASINGEGGAGWGGRGALKGTSYSLSGARIHTLFSSSSSNSSSSVPTHSMSNDAPSASTYATDTNSSTDLGATIGTTIGTARPTGPAVSAVESSLTTHTSGRRSHNSVFFGENLEADNDFSYQEQPQGKLDGTHRGTSSPAHAPGPHNSTAAASDAAVAVGAGRSTASKRGSWTGSLLMPAGSLLMSADGAVNGDDDDAVITTHSSRTNRSNSNSSVTPIFPTPRPSSGKRGKRGSWTGSLSMTSDSIPYTDDVAGASFTQPSDDKKVALLLGSPPRKIKGAATGTRTGFSTGGR